MRKFVEGMRGYLFPGGFGSCVWDEKHLSPADRYVENNPVRAGRVKRAWEYPGSRAKFHPGEQKADALVIDQNLLGRVANWRDFIQGEGSGGEKVLRRAMKTGRPLVGHEHLAGLRKVRPQFAEGETRWKTAGFPEIRDVSPDCKKS